MSSRSFLVQKGPSPDAGSLPVLLMIMKLVSSCVCPERDKGGSNSIILSSEAPCIWLDVRIVLKSSYNSPSKGLPNDPDEKG